MNVHRPSRLSVGAAVVLLCAAGPAFARGRAQKQPSEVRQEVRAAQRAEARGAQERPNTAARPGETRATEKQRHLAQWMEDHKNLSLPEMQRALQNEPGFRELPPQVQENRLNILARLYYMDPQQRSRMLDGVEGLERLTPQQRQQWDIAVLQLNAVPVPRRRLMTHAIIELHEMPPSQRQQVIDSPAFAAKFSPSERQTIRTILTAY